MLQLLTPFPVHPAHPAHPVLSSGGAPMTVKTQYTGPFFPENGHGNLCLTMDILRNPKKLRNPRNPRNPKIPWLTMGIHG